MLKKLTTPQSQYFYLFLIISAWFLGLCSYTSPIYYFDYSPDNNAFFTVGKAMMHGIVPYKDIFEQKGPYLYFVHGLASLITPRSLTGMFPLEVLSLTMTIWWGYKIARLFVRDSLAVVIAVFTPSMYLFHPYFNYGDTTESLLFPFVVYLLYLVIKNDRLNEKFNLSWLQWVGLGLTVAIVFLTKYTQLGSWIVFYIFIFIYYIKEKHWNDIKRMFIGSLSGFLLGTLPWLGYFLITKSLGSFIHVYFYENIQIYANSGNSFISNILQAVSAYGNFIKGNPLIFMLGFVGIGYVLMSNVIFKTLLSKSLFLAMNMGNAVAMNMGNAVLAVYGYSSGQIYLYYELFFLPYLLIPIVAILVVGFKRYGKDLTKHSAQQIEQHDSRLIFLTVMLSFGIVLTVNGNFTSSQLFPNNASVTLVGDRHHHQQPAQIVFGNIIRNTTGSNTTLLNYGSIDMGFYTTSGVLPSNYYFQNYNISEKEHPVIIKSQVQSILKRKTEWVVLNTLAGTSIRNWNGAVGNNHKISFGDLNTGTSSLYKEGLHKNYYVVAKHNQMFENTKITYWLLRRRASPLK